MTVIIPSVLYGIYFSGLLLLEYDSFSLFVKRIRLRHRLTAKATEGKISLFFSSLFAAAFGKAADGALILAAEFIIFISAFAVAFRSFTLPASLIISLSTAAFPVILMYSRSRGRRSKASREGIYVVSELYRQYRMSGMNISEAIEKTAGSEGDYPICRKLLFILLIRLRDSSGPSETKSCCRRFGKSLGTVWGRMLSSSIEAAAISGTDISPALLDLLEQLKTAKAQAEERKRLNSEASRMTVFLVPLLYTATMLVSVKYLDISAGHFLRNQFLTAEGLLFFYINVFLFMLNILITGAVSSTKMDL